MSVRLGGVFEQAVITAAGFGSLNVEPGSLQIDELSAPDVTVRVTVIGTVPRDVVNGFVCDSFLEGEEP